MLMPKQFYKIVLIMIIPLIIDSPVLNTTVKEVTTLYNHPEVLESDEDKKAVAAVEIKML